MLDLKSDQVAWADGNAWAPCIEEKMVDGKYKYFFYFSGNPVAGGGKQIGVAVAIHPLVRSKTWDIPLLLNLPWATDSRLMWMCLPIRFRENPICTGAMVIWRAPN